MYQLTVDDISLCLLSEKALYLPQYHTLFISDVHLGKSAHFRKNGIPLTEAPQHYDLEILQRLFESYNPNRVIFLGDLFHSKYNESWNSAKSVLKKFQKIEFILIKGNHDILTDLQYAQAKIQVIPHMELQSKILFSHEPMNEKLFNVHGHLHPAIQLAGKGRQKLVLPCFWRGKNYLAMPGFGNTTGLFKIKPKLGDEVYAITPNEIIPYMGQF